MDNYEGNKRLRIPQRPMLRRSVSIIPLQDETLMVKDGKRIFTLKGGGVQLLQHVLALLDNQHDIDDIIQALPRYRETEIVKALEVLANKGLLEDASIKPPPPLIPEEVVRYEPQISFFFQFTPDRFETQQALKKAKVALFLLGDIGVEVLSSLVLSGVGEIHGIDWRKVEEADVLSGEFYRHEDLQQSRVVVAKKRASALNPYVKFVGMESAIHTSEGLRDLIREKDLAILCLDGPAPGLLNIFNEACLAEGVTWTSAHLEDEEGIVGPSVIPGVTPCYKCYELRLKANLSYYNEYMAYEKYMMDKGGGPELNLPRLQPFSTILGSYVTLEAIKLLTKFVEPMTLGHIYVLNFLNLEASLHEILKLPRCPACSPTRHIPSQKAWEV